MSLKRPLRFTWAVKVKGLKNKNDDSFVSFRQFQKDNAISNPGKDKRLQAVKVKFRHFKYEIMMAQRKESVPFKVNTKGEGKL